MIQHNFSRMIWMMAFGAIFATGLLFAEPAKVSLRLGEEPELMVDGVSYEISGVGGNQHLELLKQMGGNTIRTWGVDANTGDLLDQAHQHGLKVALGLWLGHERHGFSYTNWAAVTKQADEFFAAVEKYKNHPALLLWGIGNEMEGFGPESNPAIYTQIEYLAREIKKRDPNHPTMTVTAEIGKKQIEALNRFCPSIDIHGINSYGGVVSIPKRYKQGGGTKPYIITEYGPPGTWETGKNQWGMHDEMSSTRKAAFYQNAYQTVHGDPLCLGSFAFVWGSKQESSATWFGMLLPTGEKLACVDALSKLWTGKAPKNRCPKIESISLVGPNRLFEQGEVIEVKQEVSDPDANDELTSKWVLAEDWQETAVGGDARPTPPSYPDSILAESTAAHAKIKLPDSGGTFRIYSYVYDGKGSAATASISINVKGKRKPPVAKKLQLPNVVAGGGPNNQTPWVPSGWMGDSDHLKFEEHSADSPKIGEHCLKVIYTSDKGWAGIVWQNPGGDWGDLPGGFDLSGAKSLSFWAKGATGGEKVKVGMGIIGEDKTHFDTTRKDIGVTLTNDWKKHQIDLSGNDLSRIKSALFFSVGAQGDSVTFYLDEVTIETE